MITENANDEYKNLGYANGWGEMRPEEITNCRANEQETGHKHNKESLYVARCVTRYICHTCKYYYHVDSGD